MLERTSARGLVDRLAAAAPGRDDDVNLLDREWQRELFAWREAHSLRAAHAHVHRLVLDAFTAAVEGCTDDGTRALLSRTCDHGLGIPREWPPTWSGQQARPRPERAREHLAPTPQPRRSSR